MPKSAEERLEKIATYLLSEDLMQKWDTWRRLLVGGHVGSYPRDCFEAEMHGIAEEANSIAAAIREDRAEMTEKVSFWQGEAGLWSGAFASERQRREHCETALREWEGEADNHSSWTDNPTARYFRKYEPIPADREEERGG